jgi:ankyrin repeat protein
VSEELFRAIEDGDSARVRSLLGTQPSIGAARDASGVSALLYARYYGQDEIVEILREQVTLDIFEAAALGDEARLKELLREAGSVDAWSSDGFTPLHLASFFGHPIAVRLLLEGGADVSAVSRNDLGVQPLNSAAAGGHVDVARELLDSGADVNARSHAGFTPLHAAAEHGDRELADLLLERDGDAAARLDDGRLPEDLAHAKGHGDVAALLASARAGTHTTAR